MKTCDLDVRASLNNQLFNEVTNERDTLIINELVLCQGEARADLAVVNGILHGYEIKSDRDTLDRLPKQIEVYNKVFDEITIVTGENHLKHVTRLVPKWWGISIATKSNENNVKIDHVRISEPNIDVDAFSLAQFLWRDEIIKLLLNVCDKEVKKLPKFKLWPYVAEKIELVYLKDYVRQCIKSRSNYKSV